jgi:hypothetical protein
MKKVKIKDSKRTIILIISLIIILFTTMYFSFQHLKKSRPPFGVIDDLTPEDSKKLWDENFNELYNQQKGKR